MTTVKQAYEWVKTGHWSLRQFKEWAQPEQEPVAWHNKIVGMEISMDVSTNDGDAHHRVFGRVCEVMLEASGATSDTILAVEDSRNFTTPPQRKPTTT